MKIIADLHIHSPYSRATSSRLSPAGLERWARIKGIGLLGSGDCTHPQWLTELRGVLDEAGEGLYVLNERARSAFDAGPALTEGLPTAAAASSGEVPGGVRFALSGEISTIYKKDGKTRKVHHLVLLPDFKAAAAFNAKLERVGNIRSDGRPILGIDSGQLLSILLETDDRALLVPAHIWTPWFSALGAKSGFDSIEECYGALSSRIPAVETGLSSNPPMNWALSALDRYAIISNSDAHSPEKLGREATLFEMELSFASLGKALRSVSVPGAARGESVLGTIEFFPQEGKYHYDGHRNCRVYLAPAEAVEKKGLCPVCGKALTRGVLGRVLELADRAVDECAVCPEENPRSGEGGANRRPYYSLVPLRELVSELLETGGASKKVEAAYGTLIEKAGNEFSLLLDMPPEQIEKLSCPGVSGELLAKAIDRVRRGDVSIEPGYDGEYGVIRAFAPGEQKETGASLFEDDGIAGEIPKKNFSKKAAARNTLELSAKPVGACRTTAAAGNSTKTKDDNARAAFTPDGDQLAAISSGARYALIIAGPGTGKTAVLAAKIARVIREGSPPDSVLALSFTVQAAAELRERIIRAAGGNSAGDNSPRGAPAPRTSTFHSLCASILREHYAAAGLPEHFKILGETERGALLETLCAEAGNTAGAKEKRAWTGRRLGDYIEERKRFLLLPGESVEVLSRILPFDSAPLLPGSVTREDAHSVPETLYAEYRNLLRSRGLVDYDGLVAGTVRLFALRKDILCSYREKFRHIFVDEYQDINFAQYALIRLLVPAESQNQSGGNPADGSGEDSPSLSVIGDPNQAIYGFRGSGKIFIDRFPDDYPDAPRFELRKSFRCAEPIIKAAGRLAGTDLSGVKDDVSGGASKKAVRLFRKAYPTDKSEAEGIARAIASLVGGTSFFAIDSGDAGSLDGSASPADCAILLRAAGLAEPVVKALENHGIPFEVAGASVWWEEDPLNYVLDFLRERGHPPADAVSAEEAIRAAWQSVASQSAASQSAARKTAKTKKSRRAENLKVSEKIEQLARLAGLFGTPAELLDALSIGRGIPEAGPQAGLQGVKVMTIHASKGLEFDHVFVPGLEDGILPFTLYGDKQDIEEERRILYVAMTRARRFLWLSHSAARNYGSRVLKCSPSRFLAGLETLVPLDKEDAPRRQVRQMRLF